MKTMVLQRPHLLLLHSMLVLLLLRVPHISSRPPLPGGLGNHPTCNRSIETLTIQLEGCKEETVNLFGCSGYCKSDAAINIITSALEPKCDCCKPVDFHTFYVTIKCPGRKEKIEFVKLISAKECACQPCLKYLNNPSVDNTQQKNLWVQLS